MSETLIMPDAPHLYSSCRHGFCRNPDCPERVKADAYGRWYITMGHAGFNTPANNRFGYSTEAGARRASLNLDKRSAAREVKAS